MPTVARHRGIDHRQAEPGSFSFCLCGEKRLEDTALHVIAHAFPGIFNAYLQERSRNQAFVPATEIRVNVHEVRGNDQATSLRHCVFGIDAEIHQHLLNLAWISFDRALLRPLPRDHGYSAINGPGNDIGYLIDELGVHLHL